MSYDTDKKLTRRRMSQRRDALTEEERVQYSDRIAERLFAREEYRQAEVVLSYASYRSEVITDRINRQILADGKKLYLPRTYMERKEMVFFRVKDMETDLVSGTMGIREPVESECFGADVTPLILVPGVAFDEKGTRMGYGGGFYDRFFSENHAYTERSIFLAYEIQRAEELPSEPTDIRLKHVLTERDFYDIL